MKQPIGIFDAGIGSYAIVERVQQRFPQQDIVYLADRASFPYGDKSAEALLASVTKATRYLQQQGCGAVILASNAPSVMVLEQLCTLVEIPVVGIFPPVLEALRISRSGRMAVLGVKSMVASEAMQRYVAHYADDVLLVNASSMVDLVESFTFLKDVAETRQRVAHFVHELLDVHPDVDVMTLSSTHLPWLRPFFETAAPHITFLDPADSVLEQIEPHTTAGTGAIRCVASETAALPLSEFNAALAQLGVEWRAAVCTIAE
jgi:glutamate racemase